MKKPLAVILLSLSAFIVFAQNPDEEAIKKMLRQETIDAYAAKNVNGYFVESTKTFRGWNTRSGYEVDFGIDAIKKRNETAFNINPRSVNPINENFSFKFYTPEACLVTYDQYLYGKENVPSKETRMVEKINGLWKIAGAIALWDYSGNPFEQNLVRTVIENETKAYHAGNLDLLMQQWDLSVNYAERMKSNLKQLAGSNYIKGDNLRAFTEQYKKTAKPTGQTYKTSDYDAHISSSTAWVTYTQETFNADGSLFGKTREMRILERRNGWKIVAMAAVDL